MTINLSNEDYERLRNIAKAMGIIPTSPHYHGDFHRHAPAGYNCTFGVLALQKIFNDCHRNDGWFVDMMERMYQRIFEEASGEAKGG